MTHEHPRRVKLGNLVADCGPTGVAGKRRYVRIGSAFHDGNGGNLAIKIDSLPLAQQSGEWQGWCNVYPDKESSAPAAADDDIPF